MIKNIVFDIGGVLVDYLPKRYLKHIGLSDEEAELFNNIIFWGKEWFEYNSDKIDVNEMKEILLKNYPQYANKIDKIITNIDYNYILFEKYDTAQYLKQLKNEGYKIYLLSDLSIDSYNFNKKFDFFNYIDGGVYSFEVGSTKPNEINYKTLLNKYSLIPNETIFIDDNINNINAGNKLGIIGILFTNLKQVKKELLDEMMY